MALHWIASPSSCWRVARAVVLAPREPVTLEQLRGDLSHEPASKLARLAGLLRQWNQGRVLPADGRDATEILDDLERLYLRHARFAAAGLGTLGRLVNVVARITELRRRFTRTTPGPGTTASHARTAATLEAMRAGSQALVEALSARYAARFAEVVREGAEEAARESRGASVAVEVDTSAADGGTWTPRAEAATWRDLVRNLVRNGVQASEERLAREDAPEARRVAVVVRPSASSGGAVLEVTDAGAGMDREQADSMWRAGTSTRGAGHGQGLTEAKLEFVRARAAVELRSEPGAGTCVRLDLPRRDLALRRPRLWQTPVAAAAALLVTLAAAGAVTLQPRPGIATAEIENRRDIVASDRRGERLFRVPLPDEIVVNDRGSYLQRPTERGGHFEPLVLPRSARGGAGVVVATRPRVGPSVIRRLDARGREGWHRELRWIEPSPPVGSADAITCRFLDLVGWNRDSAGAIALNVRKGDSGPTSLQFYSAAGESLGAYYHPGHLTPCGTYDLDGDGRYEMLFGGLNNLAGYDRSFLPADPGEDFYVDCLVLLRGPEVNGQAWPYSRWLGIAPAREAAYLLFPPLEPGLRPEIHRVSVAPGGSAETSRIDVVVADGRIYRLDGRLRPLSCTTGDHTRADSLGLRRALVPFAWFERGERRNIDVPIGGE